MRAGHLHLFVHPAPRMLRFGADPAVAWTHRVRGERPCGARSHHWIVAGSPV